MLCLILISAINKVIAQGSSYWTDPSCYSIDWYNADSIKFNISNAAELAGVAYLVNMGKVDFEGKTIGLTNDINLAEYEWVPVGDKINDINFRGVFDGNNHTIKGLRINHQGNGFVAGLFGFIQGAVVKNVILDSSCHISTTHNRVAGIAGNIVFSTIENCFFEGSASGSWYVAGMVGYGYASTISKCSNWGSISGDGYIGGIIGTSYMVTIDSCTNHGHVNGYMSVAGIVGFFGGHKSISNCNNLGRISGNTNIGGIVGKNYELSWVTNCHNKSTIRAHNANAGGISGNMGEYTHLVNCSNTDTIIGVESVGGVVGEALSYVSVNNCFNTGNLMADTVAGGIVGSAPQSSTGVYIGNCYSAGSINASNYGGIIGSCGTIIINDSYYLEDFAPQSNEHGIAQSASFLTSAAFVNSLNGAASTFNSAFPDSTAWLMWTKQADVNNGFPFHSTDSISGLEINYTFNQLTIYPNPANSTINVKVDKGLEQSILNIYNSLGEVIITTYLNNDIQSININNLSKGIYIINIISNNKLLKSGRFIKI